MNSLTVQDRSMLNFVSFLLSFEIKYLCLIVESNSEKIVSGCHFILANDNNILGALFIVDIQRNVSWYERKMNTTLPLLTLAMCRTYLCKISRYTSQRYKVSIKMFNKYSFDRLLKRELRAVASQAWGLNRMHLEGICIATGSFPIYDRPLPQ